MVSNDTQQYLLRLFGWALALILVGMFLTMVGSIFYFGDGEAVKIISDLSSWWYGALASVVLFVLGHQITQLKAFQASQGVAVATVTAGAGAATSPVPSTTTTPSAAPSMPIAPIVPTVPTVPVAVPTLADAAQLTPISSATTLGELVRGALVAAGA